MMITVWLAAVTAIVVVLMISVVMVAHRVAVLESEMNVVFISTTDLSNAIDELASDLEDKAIVLSDRIDSCEADVDDLANGGLES